MIHQRLGRLSDELESELIKNILPYWMIHAPDHRFGGFHGHLTHRNEAVPGAGKGAILNTRILWTFSAAYRMFPDRGYMETAQRAFQYILGHFLDRENGGIYWELDHRGEVKASRKQIYAIAFGIYAFAEYWTAFRDETALKAAISLFRDIESHALDHDRNGYTEALSRDWKPVEDLRLSEKDQNESKTMNTHLHIMEAYANLYRIWKDPVLEKALKNLIMLFLEKFVDRETFHLNLFFDDEWVLKSSLISYGHDIECAWLLHEAAEVLGDPELMVRTGPLAVEMARANFAGMDPDGGLIYEHFPEGEHYDTDKHWWPQAEAMVGHFNAFQLSGEEVFALKSISSWEFIKERIIDREYGEWYWGTTREGTPITEKEKAGFWKCPYHNSRACMEMITRIDKPLNKDKPN